MENYAGRYRGISLSDLIIFDIYENNVYNVQREPEVKRGF